MKRHEAKKKKNTPFASPYHKKGVPLTLVECRQRFKITAIPSLTTGCIHRASREKLNKIINKIK
jgi:hypothetical protein